MTFIHNDSNMSFQRMGFRIHNEFGEKKYTIFLRSYIRRVQDYFPPNSRIPFYISHDPFFIYWNISSQIVQRNKSKKEANGKQSNCKEHRFITNHQSSFNVPYINLRNPGDSPIIYQFRYSSIFWCEKKRYFRKFLFSSSRRI